MPCARVNDVTLYYEVHGDGPSLVLFNGLGANMATWDAEFVQGLATRFRTIVFDNRGTGGSDGSNHGSALGAARP
jgi:3-oxoadipate enol-lactonase